MQIFHWRVKLKRFGYEFLWYLRYIYFYDFVWLLIYAYLIFLYFLYYLFIYFIIFYFFNFFLCKFSIDEVNLNGFCFSLSWIQGPCLKMWKSRSTFVSATFHYGNISSLWRTPALPDLSYKIRWSIYPFTCFPPTNILICVIDVDRFN